MACCKAEVPNSPVGRLFPNDPRGYAKTVRMCCQTVEAVHKI